MRCKGRLLSASVLASFILLNTGSLLVRADDFNADQIADSIYREAQRQSINNNQSSGNTSSYNGNSAQHSQSSSPSYSPSRPASSSNYSSIGNNDDDDNNDAGLSSNNSSSSDDFGDDNDSSTSVSSTPKHSHSESSSSHSHRRELSPKEKAAIRADNYLAKIRAKLALRTAENNDGGAWDLRHSYENQLQVIKQGSRTAQTRALQVQLSGELNQLQTAHDKRVALFNQKIDQLPNNHSTDTEAVHLQDAIDYEDAKLSQKQTALRKSYAKQIKNINPVNKKKALKKAKQAYRRQLKEKGLKDPYKLQKENRQAWQKAQEKAKVMREDY